MVRSSYCCNFSINLINKPMILKENGNSNFYFFCTQLFVFFVSYSELMV